MAWGMLINTFPLMDFLASSMTWLLLGSLLLCTMLMPSMLWWMLLFSSGLCFLAQNFILFYLMFELSLIPIFLMIMFWGNQPERISASTAFIMYTVSLSIPLLLFIVLIMKNSSFFLPKTVLNPITLTFIILPFLMKLPIFGLHFWLPKAHVEASTSGSMILAGLLLKLGGFGMMRLASLTTLKMTSLTLWMLMSLTASAMTLNQSDTKKLVAYSSVTHMTFLMMALMSSSKEMSQILILLSLAHGWTSAGMFFSAGTLSHATHSRMLILSGTEGKFHPFLLMSGLILTSNAAIPPLPSFFPELSIINIASSINMTSMLFIFLSIMVCYYNTYLFLGLKHNKSTLITTGNINTKTILLLAGLLFFSFLTLLWLV